MQKDWTNKDVFVSEDDLANVRKAEKMIENFEEDISDWMKTLSKLMELKAFVQVLHEKLTLLALLEPSGALRDRGPLSELQVPRPDTASDLAGPNHDFLVDKMRALAQIRYHPGHVAQNPDNMFMTHPVEEISREDRNRTANLCLFRLKQVLSSFLSDPEAGTGNVKEEAGSSKAVVSVSEEEDHVSETDSEDGGKVSENANKRQKI